MAKRKTISQRWYAWTDTPGETLWAYLALLSFTFSMAGLVIHLGSGWILNYIGLSNLIGLFRTIGLFMLIGFDLSLLGITFWRKQLWWFWFFIYITVGVIAFEIASYFGGN